VRALTATEPLSYPANDGEGGSGNCPLYVNEIELHRRVAPHLGKDRFRAAVRACERRGFPPVNPLWRGRYWPAVKRWLDDENGLSNHGFIGTADDGPEKFDASAR
jgi:hypothetical protein